MPYTLNGQQAHIDEEPHDHEGRVFVPLRPVVAALGGVVTWDHEAGQVAATIGQWTANFKIGDDTAAVNGTVVQFPAPAHAEGGELYVPAEFFHNAYGYKVEAGGAHVSISL